MTMQHLGGRQVFEIAGRIVGVDEAATILEAEQAIRAALSCDAVAQLPAGSPVRAVVVTAAPDPAIAGEALGDSASPATNTMPVEREGQAATSIEDNAAPAHSSAALIPTVNAVAAAPRQPSPKASTMSKPASGSFAASIRAMMDEAREGVAQARAEGLARVSDAVSKLHDAKTATRHVTGQMAATIESEAADVLAELGQISNDLGSEQAE